jgi:hypothetical protein
MTLPSETILLCRKIVEKIQSKQDGICVNLKDESIEIGGSASTRVMRVSDIMPMPVECVTIGDARRIKSGEIEAFWTINWNRGCELARVDFNYEELVSPGTCLYADVNDASVDDDDLYEWGESVNTLLKVTKDLLKWAKDADGFLKRMQQTEHRDDLVRITKQKRAADDALFEALKKMRADPSQATLPFLLRDCLEGVAQKKSCT